VAARIIGVHPRTLRTYEAAGLLRPEYSGARRLYSQNDIQWITCLRSLVHEEGISIPGIKRLMELLPCWEIARCPREVHEHCGARVDFSAGGCQCDEKRREENPGRIGHAVSS
jgi:MerR family transcriptional regulator/heat shock protein HspR